MGFCNILSQFSTKHPMVSVKEKFCKECKDQNSCLLLTVVTKTTHASCLLKVAELSTLATDVIQWRKFISVTLHNQLSWGSMPYLLNMNATVTILMCSNPRMKYSVPKQISPCYTAVSAHSFELYLEALL